MCIDLMHPPSPYMHVGKREARVHSLPMWEERGFVRLRMHVCDCCSSLRISRSHHLHYFPHHQVAPSRAALGSGMGIYLQGGSVSRGQRSACTRVRGQGRGCISRYAPRRPGAADSQLMHLLAQIHTYSAFPASHFTLYSTPRCLPGLEIPALPPSSLPMDGWIEGGLAVRQHPESSCYSMCLDEGGSMDASEWPVVEASSSISWTTKDRGGPTDLLGGQASSALREGQRGQLVGSNLFAPALDAAAPCTGAGQGRGTLEVGVAAAAEARHRGDVGVIRDDLGHQGDRRGVMQQRLPASNNNGAHAPVSSRASDDDRFSDDGHAAAAEEQQPVGCWSGGGPDNTAVTVGWSGGCENPFAVGHLVNHSGGTQPNVRAASFLWRHALPLMASEPAAAGLARFRVPNQIVSGFWFVCPTDGTRIQVG